MKKIVCFTGHREIAENERNALNQLLMQTLEQQILQGATVFRAGGALGFDTLAARAVLSLRKQHPQIRLELFLPCPTQTRGWKEEDVALYERIKAEADLYRYTSAVYYRGVLQMRNIGLVTGANTCIAFLRNSQGGGSAFTASLALKNGLTLINLADQLPRD